MQLLPALDAPRFGRSHRGPAANHGLLAHDAFGEAVVLTQLTRQGPEGARLRDVLGRMRTYSLAKEDADWLLAFQADKQPHRAWIEENGLYLFSTHAEEWVRNKAKVLELNAAGASVAVIFAQNSGPHAKAAADAAGGLPRRPTLCRGARFMLTSGVCQEWGLYNGAIGAVVDVLHREGASERPAGRGAGRLPGVLRPSLLARFADRWAGRPAREDPRLPLPLFSRHAARHPCVGHHFPQIPGPDLRPRARRALRRSPPGCAFF